MVFDYSYVLSLILTLALAQMQASLRNALTTEVWRALMSKEFERLKALLCRSEPADWEPQVDRGEAAKLAARWGWIVRRAQERRAELPHMRRPDRGALFGPGAPTERP